MIHFDADHNIHCVVTGRKDFMMIDPKFAAILNVTQVSKTTVEKNFFQVYSCALISSSSSPYFIPCLLASFLSS